MGTHDVSDIDKGLCASGREKWHAGDKTIIGLQLATHRKKANKIAKKKVMQSARSQTGRQRATTGFCRVFDNLQSVFAAAEGERRRESDRELNIEPRWSSG